jgi:hypothetical protein
VTLSNRGPDSAANAAISFAVHGLKVLVLRGPAATSAINRLRCSVRSIAAGKSATVSVSLVAAQPGTKTIGDVVGYGGGDPVDANNRASASVAVARHSR